MSDSMTKRKKIGVLGGTFNPVHIGHLLLADWAREAVGLDQVWFIPTGRSYQKKEEEIADCDHRLKMLQLALEGNKAARILDVEMKRPGNSYTYITMEELAECNPDVDFWFIFGADCLFGIENWLYPERIFKTCSLLAATRGETPLKKLEDKKKELLERFGGRIELISFPAMEISSTMIRDRIRRGLSIRYLVPDPVIAYMDKVRLYENIGKQADS